MGGPLGEALFDVLDTPVSPELSAPKDGEIAQKTEELVGPYELHDFFLYYLLRFGFARGKIYRMACQPSRGSNSPAVVKKCFAAFYRRFFTPSSSSAAAWPDGPPSVGVRQLCPPGGTGACPRTPAELWRLRSSAFPSETFSKAERTKQGPRARTGGEL